MRAPVGRGARALGGLAALAAAAGVAGGCGAGKEHANLVAGKAMFVQKCGSCHALGHAGTSGQTGPDLDAAFRQSRADGITSATIAGVVRDQIMHPAANGVMPSGLATGDQADDIAAYVAQVASRPGKDGGLLASVGGITGTTGKEIFASATCGSCHRLADAGTTGTTGPDLDQALSGKDAAFIEKSIVDPNAEIASGYPPNVMPEDFGKKLKPAQLKALVGYLSQSTGGK